MLNSEEISADKIKSGFGGYKKKATKEFIDAVRNDYETLYKENLELKDKISVLSEGVQYYKNMEKSLQKALVLAERTTSETVHAAEVKALAMEKEAKARAEVLKKEAKVEAEACEKEAAAKANQMIREAKAQADLAISEGNEELRRIHSQIMTLIQQYEQYKTQYKQLAMAQMNVLESEAYNLDAPILKTLQKGIKKEEDTQKEHEVVQPVQPVVKEVEENEETEEKKEKKMYVDARGNVVEVHEFREVTHPYSGPDPFAADSEEEEIDTFGDNISRGVESFDDEEDIKNTDTSNVKSPVEISEAISSVEDGLRAGVSTLNKVGQETQNTSQQETYEFTKELNLDNSARERRLAVEDKAPSDVKVSMADGWMPDMMADDIKESNYVSESRDNDFDTMQTDFHAEKSQEPAIKTIHPDMKEIQRDMADEPQKDHEMSNAAMREIERMQLERLRQEEEKHTEELRRSRERKSYFSVGTTSAEKPQSSEKDFFENATFKQESPEISLHEIQKKEDEWNQQVPLPKATQENLYFSDSFENLKKNDENDESETSFFGETTRETEKPGAFFEQFADNAEDGHTVYNTEENRNSLDFQMDHNDAMPAENHNNGGFKSFRDFESEL